MKTDTLFGASPLEVTLASGDSQQVFVHQLPIRQMPELLAVMDDENRLAELYCQQPQGWSDTLTRESSEAVVIEGERLNGDFFSRWVGRRLARQEKVMPGITEKLAHNAGLPLPTGSPSAPSAVA